MNSLAARTRSCNNAAPVRRTQHAVSSRHLVKQQRGPAAPRSVQFNDQFMAVLQQSLEREEQRVSGLRLFCCSFLDYGWAQQSLPRRRQVLTAQQQASMMYGVVHCRLQTRSACQGCICTKQLKKKQLRAQALSFGQPVFALVNIWSGTAQQNSKAHVYWT